MPIARLTILLLRGAVNIVFALHLFTSPELKWPGAFHDLGYYAAVDGALALIMAGVIAGRSGTAAPLSLAVTMVDGLCRLGVALVVWLAPGVPYFAITSALFFATLAACAAVIGAAWGLMAFHGRDRQGATSTAPRLPLAFASAASLLLGAALFLADPGGALSRRVLFAAYALALGVAFLAAAWHHRQQFSPARPQRS